MTSIEAITNNVQETIDFAAMRLDAVNGIMSTVFPHRKVPIINNDDKINTIAGVLCKNINYKHENLQNWENVEVFEYSPSEILPYEAITKSQAALMSKSSNYIKFIIAHYYLVCSDELHSFNGFLIQDGFTGVFFRNKSPRRGGNIICFEISKYFASDLQRLFTGEKLSSGFSCEGAMEMYNQPEFVYQLSMAGAIGGVATGLTFYILHRLFCHRR